MNDTPVTTMPSEESVALTVQSSVQNEMTALQQRIPYAAITTDPQLTEVSGVVVEISKYEDIIEKQRTTLVKPLNDTVKRLNDIFKSRMQPIALFKSKLKMMQTDYYMEKRRQQEEAARAAQLKQQEEQLAAAEALIRGQKPILEIVGKEIVQDVPKTMGGTTFRDHWVYTVTNLDAVDRVYLMVNDLAVKQAIAAGRRDPELTGIHIYNDPVPVNR
jgi:hypothetical protein